MNDSSFVGTPIRVPSLSTCQYPSYKDFHAAIKFVNAVAGLAAQAWHHPDIDIRWNKVALTLTTHDAGGLTRKDFALARQFDRLAGPHASVAG